MKYLIQNRKEFAISIGFFVMTAINLIKAVKSRDITQDLIVAMVYALFGVLAWFYNMPTSEENCRHTGAMRLEKEQNNSVITGEDFTDEAESFDFMDEEEGDEE